MLDIMEPGTLALSFNGGKDACAVKSQPYTRPPSLASAVVWAGAVTSFTVRGR
jgi:hypothetical protein